MIKAMIQEYNGVKLRKTPEAIKAAKFTHVSIPLRNDHYNYDTIGEASNFRQVGDEWRGDIYFDKSKLNEIDLGKLRRLEKKDLSLGYNYKLHKIKNDKFEGDMTDLLINHLAWVDTGRCSSADGCGLDSAEDYLQAHDKVIIMTKCDEIEAENKQLREKLTANDADYKAQIETLQTLNVDLVVLNKGLDARIAEYEVADKADTIKEIIERSNYAEDSLTTLTLKDLKEKLETLKMGKAHDSYPPGKNVKKEDINYDVTKTQDMTKLAKKPPKPEPVGLVGK